MVRERSCVRCSAVGEHVYSKSCRVPVYAWEGAFYVRVSAQIYNDLNDWKNLGSWILTLIQTA